MSDSPAPPDLPAARHQRFLDALDRRLRHESDPDLILAETVGRLAQHMGANRTGYGEFDRDAATFHPRHHWTDGSVVSIDHPVPFAAFGPAITASHRAGEIWVHGGLDDPKLDAEGRAACAALGIVAVITVPVLKDGRLRSLISVQHGRPHRWDPADITLMTLLAERTWAHLERARAETGLAESEARLAAIMRHAPIGIHLKDRDGRFRLVNETLARLAGLPAADMIGRTEDELFDAPFAAAGARDEAAALACGDAIVREGPSPAGGVQGHMLSMRFPVQLRDGAELAGFTIDLSDRVRAEADLARSREALYQSEKLNALGSLLAGVAHELNNPLAILLAQAELLAREVAGTPAAARVDRLHRAAERSARIVRTFLTMARQKAPSRSAFRLNAVVADALELMGYGLRAAGVAIIVDVSPQLPPLSGDKDQIHQVLVNLIVNAQQAMADTERPRLLLIRADLEGGHALLDIADSGHGIPPEIARRVFEPFFSTKPEGEGTGFGLSFSRGIVEAHGGTLELVPSAEGATFRMRLPLAEPAAAPMAADPAVPERAGGPRRAALIVDDEPEVADSLADILDLLGWDATVVQTGAAALAALADGRDYALLVSDLRMPDMDGMALHAALLERHPASIARLAFSTGDTLGEAVQTFIDGTGRPVLRKPFTIADVATMVAAAVG